MTKKNKDYSFMIEEIVENFNFKRCYEVMKILNWGWGFENTIPTIEKLKSSARERLENVITGLKTQKIKADVPYFSFSGGLKAEGWTNKYGYVVGLKLEFVLTEWESDGDVVKTGVFINNENKD